MNPYVSKHVTANHSFTGGIEGPACDRDGNLYAVNYGREGTIGIVYPDGSSDLWIELPSGSIGNGIRFSKEGDMYIADYVKHCIYKVASGTKQLSLFAHEPKMNQPNDIAITSDGTLFASDPNWDEGTGNIWRIDQDGSVQLLASGLGTTNGIEVDPEERRLYVNESLQRKIWVYDLDSNWDISNKRLFIAFDDYSLDGMRCDSGGNLYVTRHGKGVVAKLSTTGQLLTEIAIDGKNCTNICFGGIDGKSAYVTVADEGNIQSFRIENTGRCWEMWKE